MHVKEPTSLLAKEQGEIPLKWSDSQTYEKRVYDVDPSWFTKECYITHYERRQPGKYATRKKKEPASM